MKNSISIEGNDFYLKTLTASIMSQDYPSWLNDPLVNRYLESRHNTHTKSSCEEYIKSFDQDKNFLFGVFEKKSDKHIGNVTIYFHPHHRTASFGYIIGAKEFWGTQSATEAIYLLLEFSFKGIKALKVWGVCYSTNLASVFNFSKFGFKREGQLKKHFREGEHQVDSLYYGIFSEEWSHLRDKKFSQLKGNIL
jgi:[ribosomal protein S5]-alanine N-acetyltransferase